MRTKPLAEDSKNVTVERALRDLLYRGARGTQADIADELTRGGVSATQTSVSRALKRLRAEKLRDESGHIVWRLPQVPGSLATNSRPKNLVIGILSNDNLIVIHTEPGAAGQVAYLLDRRKPGGIIGTIAGDDTVFVAPRSGSNIKRVVEEIRRIF